MCYQPITSGFVADIIAQLNLSQVYEQYATKGGEAIDHPELFEPDLFKYTRLE